MTPERWRHVTGIFHEARARNAASRPQFLEKACGGDAQLRAEVEAMLAADAGAGQFGNAPLVLESETMPRLESGSMVGPYRIEALIGAGGMGQVYRARDARIARDVAIKVLPEDVATDRERLRRFEQEARVSGALNHPNVLTLFDVGTAQGRPYLVMELLDGQTLRDRLGRGAMSPPRACEVAVSIARGLAAAHAKGIVHRDLKPENVMVTRDERVKILDFGIAKLRAPEPTPDAGTVTAPLGTQAETMIGTAGYMSPEQIRGLPADERADLFALGAILFELLTGRRAFDRDSRVETLNATLHEDPPVASATAVAVSPTLDRIVARCLDKDPDARFQSARDLAFALEMSAGSAIAIPTTTPAASRPWVIGVRGVTMLAVGVSALAALAIWTMRPPSVPVLQPLARFILSPPPRMEFDGVPAISPDGSLLVFAAQQGPIRRLFLRRIDQLTIAELPETDGAISPFFSPDGKSIGFWADGAIKRMSIAPVGPPRVMCSVELPMGGTWMADGSLIFGSIVHPLQRVSADGGTPSAITTIDATKPEIDHHSPKALPGDRAVLLTVHEGQSQFRIDALVLATSERRTLIRGGFDPQYSPTGHLVYGTAAGLSAVSFSLEKLEVTGAPVKLFDGVGTDSYNGDANFALSENGTIVFSPQVASARRTLVWMDRSGTATPVPVEARQFSTPRVSPDGQHLAVVVSEGGRQDIWVYGLQNKTFAPVTFEGRNRAPLWTRDGLRLTYTSDRAGLSHLMWQPADASAPAESLLSSKNDLFPGGWAADGGSLVYMDDPPTNNSDFKLLTMAGRRLESLPNIPLRSNWPTVSPNGRWLAFVSSERGTNIYVQPFPGPGPRRQLVEGGSQPVWSRDGGELFFRSQRGAPAPGPGLPVGDGIFVLPFDSERGVASAPEKQIFRARFSYTTRGVPSFDVSPDGRRFLLVMANDSEFDPVDMTVVLHADDEIKRRVR